MRLSLEQLSAKSNVAKNTIFAIEAGQANPTLGTIESLEKTLETEFIYLAGKRPRNSFLLADWASSIENILIPLEGLVRGLEPDIREIKSELKAVSVLVSPPPAKELSQEEAELLAVFRGASPDLRDAILNQAKSIVRPRRKSSSRKSRA